ncbi:MAG: arginine repressor [Candidatus Latescibacteria bacterium]|nr:arginine repressor [Candidatus Latescibacterota bacterium]
MSKLSRQKIIQDIVTKKSVASQDELRLHLSRRGHAVTQATLSRDIHELGLVKTPEGYSFLPEDRAKGHLVSVERLVREFVLDAKAAQNLVVVRTSAGSAQGVAAALDAESWPEVLGTVGGDDTILIVSPDPRHATLLVRRIREILN